MLAKAIWLITGPPAIGKSTVISRVILALRSEGYVVGGCVTKEERKNGLRTGFTIQDLASGNSGVLAAMSNLVGPRVGKYRVSLSDLARIGATSLLNAVEAAELVVIDEIGPMELMSPEFRRAIESCYKSEKPILAVVHQSMKDPIIDQLLTDPRAKLFEVSLENREKMPVSLSREIIRELGPIPTHG